MNNLIPNGYMQNAQGHLVPEDSIHDIDILRNELVIETIRRAQNLRQDLTGFKEIVTDDIEAFIQLAAEKYKMKFGGKKGNLSLTSYDGKYKLMIAISDTITFDERLQIAKQLVDECLNEWTEKSDVKVKALIQHSFQTDKQGNINKNRIIDLLNSKLAEDDEKWQRAMEALRDSFTVTSSKSYMRFYERKGPEGKYEQISLDVSAL